MTDATFRYKIGIVRWSDSDGIADAIYTECLHLGHQPSHFHSYEPIPAHADVILSFGPYGKYIQIPQRVAAIPLNHRPIFIQWATQNPPDLRIPWPIVSGLGRTRSWLGSNRTTMGTLVDRKMHKFRYVGDDLIVHRNDWISVLAWSSEVYSKYYNDHGIPSIVVPYGTHRGSYATMDLERDIDVLWFGKRRTRRRSTMLDHVCNSLRSHGLRVHIADDYESPFIYGSRAIEIVNRSKITLNLLPTWYDQAFGARFHMAAPNRSLIVSEPILDHCSSYEAGKHYVSVSTDDIIETIRFYLANEHERREIVESAYELATVKMTLANSIRTLLGYVDELALSNR